MISDHTVSIYIMKHASMYGFVHSKSHLHYPSPITYFCPYLQLNLLNIIRHLKGTDTPFLQHNINWKFNPSHTMYILYGIIQFVNLTHINQQTTVDQVKHLLKNAKGSRG